MRNALLRFSACAALVIALQPAPARADTWDRLTYFTFSGPVQLPGVTLAAGTYEFRLVNPETSANVMRVSSKDGKTGKLFFMLRGTQLDRAPDDPIVLLRETPAGSPPALQGWVYPGDVTPFEFSYSRRQEQALGAVAHHGAVNVADSTRVIVGSRGTPVRSARTR
jgi:hypothetical protein